LRFSFRVSFRQCDDTTTDKSGLFALGADTALLVADSSNFSTVASGQVIVIRMAAGYIEKSSSSQFHVCIIPKIAQMSSHLTGEPG
jgi:hypothetical protein